jgi:glycosyltransferase involved in cell wall biosynthesis
MKKFLIIIPFYNVENQLEESIEGILQQYYQNFHLVLINDASTDSSPDIALKYKNHPKITLLNNSNNRGAYYSVNKALSKFKDEEWDYFHFHGADDVSTLDRLEKINIFLSQNNKMLGCKTTFVRVHYDTKEIAIENGKPHITTSEGISFISKKAFQHLGYYDNTRFSGDTDYWWRLEKYSLLNGYVLGEHLEVAYIAYLRSDNNNLTVSNPIHTRQEYYSTIQNELQSMFKIKNFYRDIFI